ncbi:MAG: abortive infection family protein [Candidatus Dormiibacterota bacterium]
MTVGAAKELVESVAKVVLELRGASFGSSIPFQDLVGQAHAALRRQPGIGLAGDPPVRDIAQAASTIAKSLGPLRNSHGTGHGRSRSPEIVAEHADIAADAALLWARWALRRVDHLVGGDIARLINDLQRGGLFHKGGLAQRLIDANLTELDPEDQRRLGIAVGRRAARGTFMVHNEGVLAALDDGPWPVEYRAGLLEALFLDGDGNLRVGERDIPIALSLIDLLEEDAPGVLKSLREHIQVAHRAYGFDRDNAEAAAAGLASACRAYGPKTAAEVGQIADLVRASGNTP